MSLFRHKTMKPYISFHKSKTLLVPQVTRQSKRSVFDTYEKHNVCDFQYIWILRPDIS